MGEKERGNSKLIFKPNIARRLLKMGCKIVDIKADHNNKQRTVFVFERDNAFDRNFDTVINEMADERINKKNDKKDAKE